MLTVKRSPAKVCWHVMLGDTLITTADTKAQANELVTKLSKLL